MIFNEMHYISNPSLILSCIAEDVTIILRKALGSEKNNLFYPCCCQPETCHHKKQVLTLHGKINKLINRNLPFVRASKSIAHHHIP